MGSCSLPTSGSAYCCQPNASFVAATNGVCQVNATGNVQGTPSPSFSSYGPDFGIGEEADGSNLMEGSFRNMQVVSGYSQSIPIADTALVRVTAGNTYQFGAAMNGNGGWITGVNGSLVYKLNYVCFTTQ